MVTMETGVPSLRTALRRARRAGASVEPIHGGELRIESRILDKRVTVSARRHDATRELMGLVRDLEAIPKRERDPVAPVQLPTPVQVDEIPPYQGNGAKRPASAIVADYLERIPSRPDGWRPYPGLRVIAEALSLETKTVAAALHYAEASGKVVYQRSGRLYTAFRYADESAPEREPDPEHVVVKTLGLIPPTPALSEYAEARMLASRNPILRVELSDQQLEAVLSDATRLYHWIRASRK
jgi:hypothetical protein